MITITRVKQYAMPGRNARYAWKYIYTVHYGDGKHSGCGDMSEVRMTTDHLIRAGKATGPVVKEWEQAR